jgi:hypothetical protein
MTTTSTTPPVARSAPDDAIALLDADHETVNRLSARYHATRSVPCRKALVADICTTLTVHVQVAEEIFYPAVKDALAGKLLAAEPGRLSSLPARHAHRHLRFMACAAVQTQRNSRRNDPCSRPGNSPSVVPHPH